MTIRKAKIIWATSTVIGAIVGILFWLLVTRHNNPACPRYNMPQPEMFAGAITFLVASMMIFPGTSEEHKKHPKHKRRAK